MSEPDFSELSRTIQLMSGFVWVALLASGLHEAHRSKPSYHQNDYLVD